MLRPKTTVTIKALGPNDRIMYTIDNDGEEFARKTQPYTGPFTISETSKVEAYATNSRSRHRKQKSGSAIQQTFERLDR
jgi:hypothetical protein